MAAWILVGAAFWLWTVGFVAALLVLLCFLIGAAVVLGAASRGISDWWSRRRRRRRTASEERLADDGEDVICLWVDLELLESIAVQRKLEPDRAWTGGERDEATTTGGSIEGGLRQLLGRWSRERKHSAHDRYDIQKDRNALLRRLLDSMDRADEIDHSLHSVMKGVGVDQSMLDKIVRLARASSEDAARNVERAVPSLQAAAVREDVVRRWAAACPPPERYVLVESTWDINKVVGVNETDCFKLRLHTLHVSPPPRLTRLDRVLFSARYEPQPDVSHSEVILAPDDLNLVVQLSADGLTSQGKTRIGDGLKLTASMFGTVSSFAEDSGTLTIMPIAVFSRMWKPRRRTDPGDVDYHRLPPWISEH